MSDKYSWQTNQICTGSGSIAAGMSFDSYMTSIARPANLDVELTANYGSSDVPSCDAPGAPADAAAWVKYSNVTMGYGVKWWEIGNEVWGSYEKDMHPLAHDAATFSTATASYVSQMKAQDTTINVGVPLVGYTRIDGSGNNWDPYVLSHSTYDYVSYHAYNGGPGRENDTSLLFNGPSKFTASINVIKAELATAGRPTAPISVSEWNSVYAGPGKQTVSIVNGLYAGEVVGEMLTLGIRRAEFWNTFGCEFGGNGNYSSSLYGWQTFGSLGALSEGVPFPTSASACHWTQGETVPTGTPFPTGRAFQVLSKSGFVTDGEHVLGVSVPSSLVSVRAYAVSHGSSYALLLFNLDENTSATVPVAIEGHPEFLHYTSLTYGKTEYDLTRSNGPWVGPVSGSGATAGGTYSLTLPPWSMTVYMFSP